MEYKKTPYKGWNEPNATTDVIDEMCDYKYGHTNWAFTKNLTVEELNTIDEGRYGTRIPSVVLFVDEGEDVWKDAHLREVNKRK